MVAAIRMGCYVGFDYAVAFSQRTQTNEQT